MIERTTLMVLQLATLVIACGYSAKAQPTLSVNSSVTWLRVTPASDPQFVALAAAACGQQALATIKDVLPYSFVLTNNGSATLVAVGLRFEVAKGGRTTTRDFFYYSFPDPAKSVIAPGRSILMTPFAWANDVAHNRPRPANSPTGSADDSFVIADLAGADGIRAVIDLLIVQDGRTAGSDSAHNVSQLLSQAQAHYDMTREALMRLQRDDDAQTVAWLAGLSKQQLPPMRPGQTTDRYASMQKTLARGWLSAMNGGKRAELLANLQFITSNEDTTLSFLKSLRGGLQ